MSGKGRYSGCHMTIYGSILPGAISIARWATKVGSLTPEEKKRIKILDWYKLHGNNTSLAARHFSLTRLTIRKWQKRFREKGITGLKNQSRRPRKLREPTTSWKIVMEAVRIRKQYPAWSKYKIHALLTKQGIETSKSTIGRILKRKGLINKKIARKRRRAALHPKARFPRGYKISCPGDMIQMDIKHVMLPGGTRHYQFTAIDVLTKRRVLERYSSEASRWGACFLEACLSEFPFPINAIQTDNGSTFQKEFEHACQKRHIPHYFIYPRSPKQNSYVEISHGADEREFYQQGNVIIDPQIMRIKLKEWQRIWNEERPHQALNYLTPAQYYEKWQHGRLPTKDIITLQT